MIKITLLKNIEDTSKALADMDFKPIYDVVEILRKTKENGNTVFTFGNGGSHCNASHFAQDLLKACGIKAICISDMLPSILAYANDDSPTAMFFEPLMKFKTMRDTVIGFSCSGQSRNVVLGIAKLCDRDGASILFTGNDGGRAKEKADIVIKVPNSNIRIQESCHSVICHAIIEALLDE